MSEERLGIESIPIELLSKIFIHCLRVETDRFLRPNPREAPLLLIRVCKTWRDCAVNTPQLWCCMAMEHLCWVCHGRELISNLESWIARSRARPFSLSIFLHYPLSEDGDIALDEYAQRLQRSFSRCTVLHLRASPDWLFLLSGARCPQLEELLVACHISDTPPLQAPFHAPSLKRLLLVGQCYMASRNLLDPVPSQLTQLDWCVSNGPGTYPELLRQCQYSLTRLTIEYRRNFEDEKISLPELQYLQVNTMGFRAVNLGLLMRNLYTPALRQLVIGGLNWDDITTVDARSIMILLSLSGCCLTHLKVAFRLQPLCEDVSEFRELMQALPTLEALDLEGRSSDICATRGLREVFYSLTRDALEGGILPSLSEIIIVCECEDTELLPTNVVEAMLRSRTRIQSQTSQDRILLTYVNIRISWSHGFHQPALIWHKLNSGSIVREVAKKTENGSMMETTRMTL